MTRLFILPSTLLALVFTVNHTAFACSCVPPPEPKKALEGSVAVFSGKVTKVEIDEKKFRKEVTIEVQTVWKGAEKKTLVVGTASQGSLCGYSFKKGESYLLYCYGKKSLSTNICSRTKLLSKAGDDIKELGDGKKVEDDSK